MLAFLTACQDEQALQGGGTGYLRLQVSTNTSTLTKAETEAYNPKRLKVVFEKDGKVAKTIDDWSTIGTAESVELPTGTYTITASSYGFDGKEAGYDKPYYVGTTTEEVVIEDGKTATAAIECTLANVKVTVNFAADFKAAFPEYTVTVGDNDALSLSFDQTGAHTVGYFPVKALYAEATVKNKANQSHTTEKNNFAKADEVKARDNYILNYRLAATGNGSVNVAVDQSTRTYTFTFGVPAEPTTNVTANAWSKFAYLEASVASAAGADDLEKVKFQYKEATVSTKAADEEGWTDVTGTPTYDEASKTFKITLTGLTGGNTYQSRVVFDGTPSGTVEFTTEAETALYNGGFDDWYQDPGPITVGFLTAKNIWFANSEADYKANGAYWDSGNMGTAAMSVNPTQGNSTILHTTGDGKKSAELKSQFVGVGSLGQPAAGNIYTGTFGDLVGMSGAKLNFGQPFTSRPTHLKGFFQYTSAKINYVGGNQPANTVKKGDDDICSIYIALSKKAYLIDNTKPETFINFKDDENIIAYGELPAADCVTTKGWKEFDIPLKYKNLSDKPTHIIIVCSASKYGDYFTIGEGSLMYLDDFSLTYDGTPAIWE